MDLKNIPTMSVHPSYFIQDPSAPDVIASSIPVLRTIDNAQFLASKIPEILAQDVKEKTYSTNLTSVVLPTAKISISRILNHPNIVSLIDIVHTSSLPGSVSEASKHGDITVWEDMNAGLLAYLLPASSSLPSFTDQAKWDVLAAQNFQRFSLPEGLCWHVLRSISRALLWLHFGVKETIRIPGGWERHDDDWQPVLIMDVSPDQIWFQTSKGEEHYGPCKLGGFQYARVTGRPGGKVASAPKVDDMPLSKQYYWAPEVYNNISPPSRPSEIWSLGATLYAMMTGMPPPRTHDYYWNISRMNDKGFSDGICDVIAAMLRPNQNGRPTVFQLVDRVDDEYRRWRATTREGMEFVDVEDEGQAARIRASQGAALPLPQR